MGAFTPPDEVAYRQGRPAGPQRSSSTADPSSRDCDLSSTCSSLRHMAGPRVSAELSVGVLLALSVLGGQLNGAEGNEEKISVKIPFSVVYEGRPIRSGQELTPSQAQVRGCLFPPTGNRRPVADMRLTQGKSLHCLLNAYALWHCGRRSTVLIKQGCCCRTSQPSELNATGCLLSCW